MKKSFGDMLRSLGLMAVIIAAALFIGGRYLISPTSAERMPPVDYSTVVQGFRDEAHVAALAPTSLPGSWRPNAARLLPMSSSAHLHIGWALPGSRYAGLDEATNTDVVTNVLGQRGRVAEGTTRIDGALWDVRTSDLGERAFTRQVGGVTVVVTGNATDDELRSLAASLR